MELFHVLGNALGIIIAVCGVIATLRSGRDTNSRFQDLEKKAFDFNGRLNRIEGHLDLPPTS